MATICGWCGKRIGFTDMAYTHETVGDNEYFICGECSGRVLAAKNRRILFEEIKTEKTAPELFYHLSNQTMPTEDMLQESKVRQEQQQIRNKARQTIPLYDDIYQIAEDLRFIKNFLIFCIVIGIVLGFIFLVSIF